MDNLNYYKITCQYQGTFFKGWQIQGQGERTIQGEINKAISQISKISIENVKSLGSSRTDAGVHAHHQVFRTKLTIDIREEELKNGLNSLLPWDIRILSVEKVSKEFHPIKDALFKEYFYLFSEDKNIPPFLNPFVTQNSYRLDMEKIKRGINLFIGKWDFINYYCKGSNVDSTIREIYSAHYQTDFLSGGFLQTDFMCHKLVFIGNGFLKQMVRLLVGALFNLGRGKISFDDLKDSLNGKQIGHLGPVAPPNGLYLSHIQY
jgi:tRNA pseudouridine38-40 synthase